MIKSLIIVLTIMVSAYACQNQDKTEEYKKEVLQAESDFALMAMDSGVSAAFLSFADNDAVLNRNDNLLKGKNAIQSYFENQPFTDVALSWTPDFVDVSASGNLAYTYGKYQFSATDSSGHRINVTGIFHTVWKRQKDGSWKFVYD